MATYPAYTQARIDYLANYFQSLLPGLQHDVAVTWITAEKGVNGNVLGLTYTDSTGHQRLFTYTSQEAGLQAAAGWIKTRAYYSGINASLSTQSSQKQAAAIAASPWNSSYYKNVFAKLIGKSSTPGSSPPTGKTIGATVYPQPIQDFLNNLKSLGISTDPMHVLTSEEVKKLTDKAGYSGEIAQGYQHFMVGQTVQQVIDSWGSYFGTGAAGAAVKSIFDAASTPFIFIGVILVGVVLILVGGIITLRKNT